MSPDITARYRRRVASKPDEPSPQLRAQLLSTEHWSLLSARSTIQSELLTRITIFLTLVSAGLVSIALIGQATDFAAPFPLITVVILAFEVAIGVLTQLRVFNASMDDLVLVLGMNKVRAAYLELDPGLAAYFVTGARDDQPGVNSTYYPAGRIPARSHIAASTMTLVVVVNSALAGILVAAISNALTAPLWVGIAGGVVVGALYLVFAFRRGFRDYVEFWKRYEPSFPTAQGE